MRIILALLFLIYFSCTPDKKQSSEQVMTVSGYIDASEMGTTLEHEHIVVDFTGAEIIKQPQYPVELALDTLLPYYEALKISGVQTIIECTPNYIGRDVRLLKEISRQTGLHILTNTGYYAAAEKKYIPAHTNHETASQLGEKWIEEWVNGIDATGIKPGFIKLGVGKGPLDDIEQKIIHAGALTHLATGLKIAVHTGGAAAAFDEIKILEDHGVDPKALIIVHAQNCSAEEHLQLAKKGAWISLDGINETIESIEKYKDFLVHLKKEGYIKQTLISQDAFWTVEKNESGGIYFQHHGSPYSAIFKGLLPSLRSAGFTQEDLDQILITNPAEAYKIGVSKL